MYPADESVLPDDAKNLPVARIDGQEEIFVIPLREYLETNGCRVIFNQPSRDPVEYHIVAGSLDFVKHILETSPQLSVRRLGIVIHSSFSDAKKIASSRNKIVVVDPVQLTEQDVVEIFSFFFAGNSDSFDKRRNRHVPEIASERAEKAPAPKVENYEDKRELETEKENEKRIQTLIRDVFGADVLAKAQKEKLRQRKRRREKWKRAGAYTVATFFFFLLPVFWYIMSIAATGTLLIVAGRELHSGRFTNGQRFERAASYWRRQGEFSFGLVATPLRFAGGQKIVRGQERLLSFFRDVSSLYIESFDLITVGKEASALLLQGGKAQSDISAAVTMEKLRLSVIAMYDSMGLAQAQLAIMLEEQSFPFSVSYVRKRGEDAARVLGQVRRQFGIIEHLLVLYPQMSGFVKPATYLVLLQNSNELRATGGFIGSIAKLTLTQGVISDFEIQDVYAVDGQLKGHVDPPDPIAEILGQEHWYLRDSNWDPDFKVSSRQASWFYEKETGESVDGVIAINVPIVVDLLKVTGPLVLSDYNDRITAENFFGKSLFYTQKDFFPGSTQKRDFLGTLARTLITRLTTDHNISPVDLFRTISVGLERRDIMFYFNDADLQELVEHYQWAGRMFGQPGCLGVDSQLCFFDPFAFSETNLSVSKVNYFVSRSALREITIAPDGSVTESVTVTIKNDAQGEEPGVSGGYVVYGRFFVPADAQVQEITLDAVPIPSRNPEDTIRPDFPYIERADAPEGISGFGAAIEVAPGSSRQIRISYTRGQRFPDMSQAGRKTMFEALYYKQPGLHGTPLTTRVRFPVFWRAADETGPKEGGADATVIAKEGEFEYNTTVFTDISTRMHFTK